MKKTAVLLAAMFALTACYRSNPNYNEGAEIEETADTADIDSLADTGTSTDALTETAPVSLYDVIMNGKAVWDNGKVSGGTLLDLDFDGTPEFLVYGKNQ